MPEEISLSMEDSAAKDQSSATGRSTSRLLRYPLRSATKPKDEKPPLADSSSSISASKRARVPSSVSKSIGVFDLSGKEKSSAKPPRRLSVPNKKPNPTSTPESAISITPISETRAKRSAVSHGKSDMTRSDNSKSSTQKKFSTLSSASYWLSQIKLSESANKHSISLGFFKLALEAGCEPIQRLSDELKSYMCRHDLSELDEFVKVLSEGYKIPECFVASQPSGNSFQSPSEGNQFSDHDVKSSSSSITDSEKEKQKPVDVIINADKTRQVKKANKGTSESDDTVKMTKRSVSKRAASVKPSSEVKSRGVEKRTEKLVKQGLAQDKDKVKKQGKKKSVENEAESHEDGKENMVAPDIAEVCPTEV